MENPPKTSKASDDNIKTVPVDTSKHLAPTNALSITHTKHHTIVVQDLTSSLDAFFSPTSGLSLDAATHLLSASPAPPIIYTLKKENLLGTHLTVKSREDKEVAEWKTPILSLHAAKITIRFLGEEEQKTVVLNPVSHERISESFEINGITYMWQAESKKHLYKRLYKIVETASPAPPSEASASATPAPTTKKGYEIARYVQKDVHGHEKEGLLILDSGEIGELVAVLTLCAMLEQFHKEERNEKIYERVVSGLVVG